MFEPAPALHNVGMSRAPAALEPDADPPTRVLRQFRVVFNAVKTHYQQVERQVGLGGVQLWALALIHEHPGLGVGQLARALSVRQPTASNLVKHLVQLGLVEARREGSDRRTVQLHALSAAAGVLRRAPGPSAGVLPQALGQLDADCLRRLELDLTALIERLGADLNAAALPMASLSAPPR